MHLSGKTLVVTGASSGIGRAIAGMLTAAGARVLGVARTPAALEAVRLELGGAFVPVVLDVTDARAVQSWASALDGPVHGLINNAGAGLFKKLAETSDDDWRAVQSVNLDGVFYMTRHLLPVLQRTGGIRHIIQIASVAALLGNAGLSAYNASKFAVRGFSEALMKELRGEGIKVSCVYPGSVETRFFDRAGMQASTDILQPADIADAVRYLLETPDHVLVDELVIRPRHPKA